MGKLLCRLGFIRGGPCLGGDWGWGMGIGFQRYCYRCWLIEDRLFAPNISEVSYPPLVKEDE